MPNKTPELAPPWVRLVRAGNQKNKQANQTKIRPSAATQGYCSKAHKMWRQNVLTANAWQCQACGVVCDSTDARRIPHADHITPIAEGGDRYDLKNGQTLCSSCHAKKTTRENKASKPHNAYRFYPEWLKPALAPVTLVAGAPGSGKSYYVKQNAKPTDLVIDLDVIASKQQGLKTGAHGWNRKGHGLANAIRERNELLKGLSIRARRAWFISSEPKAHRRLWWRSVIGCEVVVIETPLRLCEQRINERTTRYVQTGAAAGWWNEYQRNDDERRVIFDERGRLWAPQKRKRGAKKITNVQKR